MEQAEQMIARYQRYLTMDPNNRELLFAYGDALHANGQFAEAKTTFEKLVARDPHDTVARSRLASVLISCHDFAGAQDILAALVSSGDPAAKFNLGLALFYSKKFADAEAVFIDLIDEPLVADEARYYLVSCLHNLDRNEEAIARAQQFLSQRHSSKLGGYLALVQFDTFAIDDAVEQAEMVLREQPDNVDAAAVLGTYCIERQDMESAERHLRLVTEREPDNIRGWQGRGLIALYRQEYEAAAEYLQTSISYAPSDVGNYNTLGWIYIIMRRFEEAEKTFRKGLSIDRNIAEAHGGLAAALAHQQKIDEARREIDLATGLDPKGFGAQVARTIVLSLQGQGRLAEDTFAKILQAPLRDSNQTLMQCLTDYWKKSKKKK